MKVTLGNPKPHNRGVPIDGPTITSMEIRDHKNEDGTFQAGYIVGSDAAAVKDHLFENSGLVTHLPGNGAVLLALRAFPEHADGFPSFVSVEPGDRTPEEAEDFERFLSEFWKCDRGIPADVEDTHYTQHGPPGTGPAPEGE